jgi:phosphoesterase RecJ-like protein
MFKVIADLINKNQEFVLTSHVNPDGDSIGCEIALYMYLRDIGKKARIINYSATPDNYLFLDRNKVIEQFDEDIHKKIILESDIIFILDTNEYSRIRTMAPYVKESRAKKVVIDHHMGLDSNGFDYALTDTASASTAEILYSFFKSAGGNIINSGIAEALYTAIMTDTGSFRFERTGPGTHLIAADLLGFGLNPYKIYSEVYNTATPGRLKLLGRFLENVTIVHNGKAAYSYLLIKDFEETSTDEYAIDGYSQYLLSISTTVLSILLTQTKRGVKISFRSKGNIPVNELAKEFGGGGHVNAAGAFVENGTIDDLKIQTVNKAEKYINQKP